MSDLFFKCADESEYCDCPAGKTVLFEYQIQQTYGGEFLNISAIKQFSENSIKCISDYFVMYDWVSKTNPNCYCQNFGWNELIQI